MDDKDLYRLRAEEFERNFQSMRGIEWRTAIEVFTGYAAIGLSYYHLRDRYPDSGILALGASVLTILLFLTNLYLSLRVQERLHSTRAMQNVYLKKLHDLCGAPELDLPPEIKRPVHAKWYAFGAQITLSGATMLTLLAYILATSCRCSG